MRKSETFPEREPEMWAHGGGYHKYVLVIEHHVSQFLSRLPQPPVLPQLRAPWVACATTGFFRVEGLSRLTLNKPYTLNPKPLTGLGMLVVAMNS